MHIISNLKFLLIIICQFNKTKNWVWPKFLTVSWSIIAKYIYLFILRACTNDIPKQINAGSLHTGSLNSCLRLNRLQINITFV